MAALFGTLLMCISSVCGEAAESTGHLSGIWRGEIQTPQTTINLYWRIHQVDADSLMVIHDSPRWGVKDVPVPEAYLRNDSLFMRVHRFPATYSGVRTGDPDLIIGQYTGEGNPFPLSLARIKDDPRALLPYMVPRLDDQDQRAHDWSYTVPSDKKGDWPVGHARDAGLDLDLLGEMMTNALMGRYPNLHSVLIARSGKLVFEEYLYGQKLDEPHPIMSNNKGIVSACVGIAVERDILPPINTPLMDIFPEYESAFDDDLKRRITLEHLLTMTSGYEWDEHSTTYYDPRNSNRQMMNSDDHVGFVLGRPLSHTPGESYTYNSGLPVVLGEAIRRATDRAWLHFASRNLFRPLGFQHEFWNFNADGTGSGVLLRPRDFIKLPQLYLQRGRWGDEQIIPSDWFDNCYRPDWDPQKPPYWNHWGGSILFSDGIPLTKYSGGGFGGQAIFGFPDLDLVVCFTAGNYTGISIQYEEVMGNYILPPLLDPASGYLPLDNSGNPGYVAIDGTEYLPTAFTGLAALRSVINFHGADIDEAWLSGITGNAFALNANSRMWPSCLGRWENPHQVDQLARLGFSYKTWASFSPWSDFDQVRKEGWQAVRASIDAGSPAIAFGMSLPESYLVYGYDDYGYHYRGMDCPSGFGPALWNRAVLEEPIWFEVHTVAPIDPGPVEDLIFSALEGAVEMHNQPENYPHPGFSFGPKAYDQWSATLSTADADIFGVVYTARGWATCRRNAVAFLRQVRELLPDQYREPLAEAVKHYQTVAESWARVNALLPYEGTPRWQKIANWENGNNRIAAQGALAVAAEAESRGIAVLERVLAIRADGSR